MVQSRATSKRTGSPLRFPLIILFVLVLVASNLCNHKEAYCAQATLAWDPEAVSGLAGYKVYYGTASRSYSSVINAGNQTTATITGLTAGTTYYLAATAYDTAGAESSFSNEVAYTVPASCTYAISPGNASFTNAAGTGSVSVNTPAGCTWTISNSNSWVTITSGGTGPSTVNYTVSSNTGSTTRTASLTIAGVAFNITQTAGSSTRYTISAGAGSGGSISPSGSVSINAGGSQSFTISPSSGYHVSAVTVDGASVGAVTSYGFTNVNANHRISATFAATTTTKRWHW